MPDYCMIYTGDWRQGVRREGIIDLGPGYPDPALLPSGLLADAATAVLTRHAAEALSYGANTGPRQLRAFLAEQVPGCPPEQVVTTAGTSSALSGVAAELGRRGAVVLTESLTYDLGRQIFVDRGLRVEAVPGPVDDLDIDRLRRFLAGRREPVAFYVMPTFHNPTGRVLGVERRTELLELAARTGMTIVEDHAYSRLSFDQVPAPLWSLSDDREKVITLLSLSKCLAPGLRLGGVVGSTELLDRLARDGERASGGGANHLTAATVAHAVATGAVARHVEDLVGELRRRRDALYSALAGRLPPGLTITRPTGGYFQWIGLPTVAYEAMLLAAAENLGVSFAPGSRFGSGHPGVRLCFAAHRPDDLIFAAERLVRAAEQIG
ncbi:PLP-dependent aminotransferase family protein [Plantactinospora sp. WMMC1484]|uniref:aminotransferase-like domain-containing protein n=1 Tax=Plantactinospora sp. WMMC1484 TaxID=3404122 RepID=UPI003BF5FD52